MPPAEGVPPAAAAAPAPAPKAATPKVVREPAPPLGARWRARARAPPTIVETDLSYLDRPPAFFSKAPDSDG
jgi:hypothetical protein